MYKYFVIAYLLTSLSKGYGQYVQFSQYNFSSQRVNPAQLGLTNSASLTGVYRNQKTGGDFNLNTSFISVSYPLLNQSTGKPWSGIGITLMDDRTSGIYKTQEAALSYAVNVRLSRFQLLSFGAKTSYRSQQISYNGFYTGSQYISDRGFDPSLSNGENMPALRNNMMTLNAGLFWQQTDRKEMVTAYWGASLFDFNRPVNSAINNESRLAPSFVFTGGIQVYHEKKMSILPELLYTFNANNHVLNLGARFQYELESTPKRITSRLDIITRYVPGRSGILGLQIHNENFSAGISYDFPVFKRNAGNLGALEMGLEIRKPVSTRTKKLKAKQRKAGQKNRKVTAKNVVSKKISTDSLTIKPDTLHVTEKPKVVEIVKTDSSQIKTSAQAGELSQESLLLEQITLHFGFEFNSVDVDDETERFLEDLSTTLKDDETLNIHIIGHTDNIGGEKFNHKLSQKRAETIRNYLIRSGVAPERLKAEGMGLTTPLVPNDSDENRAKNRRVEIKVYHQR